MNKNLGWTFPLHRPHTGAPLGNGTQGLLVWGGQSILNITIGRAGFWDHRGGNPFSEKTTYSGLRRLLEGRDHPAVHDIFRKESKAQSPIPRQIGGGRLEITLAEGWVVESATLEMSEGRIRIAFRNGDTLAEGTVIQSPDTEQAILSLPNPVKSFRLRPSWEWVGQEISAIGIEPPSEWSSEEECGFEQRLPSDDPLAIVVLRNGNEWIIGSHVGRNAPELAREAAIRSTADCRESATRAGPAGNGRVRTLHAGLLHAAPRPCLHTARSVLGGGPASPVERGLSLQYQHPDDLRPRIVEQPGFSRCPALGASSILVAAT